MAAFQAVEYASLAGVRRLERLVDAMAESDPDGDETDALCMQIIDLEFHEALVALSGTTSWCASGSAWTR